MIIQIRSILLQRKRREFFVKYLIFLRKLNCYEAIYVIFFQTSIVPFWSTILVAARQRFH